MDIDSEYMEDASGNVSCDQEVPRGIEGTSAKWGWMSYPMSNYTIIYRALDRLAIEAYTHKYEP